MIAAKTETYEIRACQGVLQDCRNALVSEPTALTSQLEAVPLALDWPGFLHARVQGGPKNHHRFRIHVAACPNGCSQPHIADFACIGARQPRMPESCQACGICVAVCPDRALALDPGDQAPRLDLKRCLNCGLCIRNCPENAIDVAASGLRLLFGGRLGRRPRLAEELPGLHASCDTVVFLEKAMRFFMDNYRPGQRLGDILAHHGLDAMVRK